MTRTHKGARWALALVIALLVTACGGAAPAAEPTAAPAEEATAIPTAASVIDATPVPVEPTAVPSGAGETLPNGNVLPDDAAPVADQVYKVYFDSTLNFTTVDFLVSVYEEAGVTNVHSEPLIRLDNNFVPQPAAALSWSSNADGTEWTFNLDPNLNWSDGTPVTAADYVHTFQYAANKDHAWDFAWFFQAPGEIKNWSKVNAGEVADDQLGVVAKDAKTLVFTTETPAPFFPAKALYSTPLQKAAFEKYGPYYNNDPKTSVSCGPFMLKEWTKGERVIWVANDSYTGTNKPFLREIQSIAAKPETFFAGYRAGEVDSVGGEFLDQAAVDIIQADEELKSQVRVNANDFRTDYLFFDNQTAPFNNVKVRQAFSHLIDRDGLIAGAVGTTQAIPAYSFLMPGFHSENSKGLSSIQSFDVEKAKALLAEAGYPDGKDFPKITLWLRNENQSRQTAAQAIADSIKTNLNIEVEVSNKEQKVFMEALNAKPTQLQFGMVSYGIDFFDASNMLGVFRSGGRHNWNNDAFDKLVDEASASNDQTGRIAQFQEAEKILVEDVGGIFLWHRVNSGLLKPYVGGSQLEPNKAGFSGIQWPGMAAFSTVPGSMYIKNNVGEYRK
jgi:ABC-type transport system substrate-binding protein